jgi:hypothetical protein
MHYLYLSHLAPSCNISQKVHLSHGKKKYDGILKTDSKTVQK